MLLQVPETVLPDWVTEPATSTPMYDGTVSGGFPALPVRVVKLVPHTSAGLCCGSVVPLAAKPLEARAARPPGRLFRPAHGWLPQVPASPAPAPASGWAPRAKAPRLGKAKTTTSAL